jgi:hypothetical protein
MLHTPCDITFDEVVTAYFDCRKNKRNSESAIEFEIDLENNLQSLYTDLRSGTYAIGESVCFVVKKPRVREIWAAGFRDRVVHHLIYNRIGPKFNRSFLADSCACIPGRGTMYGAQRLEKHIRSYTNNWQHDYFYLKCDLSNFFVSIDKSVLWSLLEPKVSIEWLSDLVYMVLHHDPRTNVVFNSSEEDFEKVPDRKKLLLAKAGFGLPIGNLTSQFFANVLMDYFDKFVKHVLKVEKYIRYVDDFVILGKSTKELKNIELQVSDFLQKMNLELNPRKTILQPIKRGVSFVGQTIYPFRRVPLNKTVNKIFSQIDDCLSHDSTIAFLEQSEKHYNLVNRYKRKISQ